MLLAFNPFSFFMDPIVHAMSGLLSLIHQVVPYYGLDLVLLALVIRLALWPFSQKQFKSMAEMQKVQPLLKAIQTKYKGDAARVNTETMALYKEHGVNPLAGCLPVILPLPILFSLFYAIKDQIDAGNFKGTSFLWIGSPLAAQFPHVIAPSLATMDYILFALYVVSMYFSIKFGSPTPSDPQQAQTQKIMAFMSPAMLAYFGFKSQWPSALILYWFAANVFTMAQQLFLFRRYGLIGPNRVTALAVDVPAAAAQPKNVTGTKTAKAKAAAAALGNGKNGASGKASPTARTYKRGAKR